MSVKSSPTPEEGSLEQAVAVSGVAAARWTGKYKFKRHYYMTKSKQIIATIQQPPKR
jgi:hypothetical protein